MNLLHREQPMVAKGVLQSSAHLILPFRHPCAITPAHDFFRVAEQLRNARRRRAILEQDANKGMPKTMVSRASVPRTAQRPELIQPFAPAASANLDPGGRQRAEDMGSVFSSAVANP